MAAIHAARADSRRGTPVPLYWAEWGLSTPRPAPPARRTGGGATVPVAPDARARRGIPRRPTTSVAADVPVTTTTAPNHRVARSGRRRRPRAPASRRAALHRWLFVGWSARDAVRVEAAEGRVSRHDCAWPSSIRRPSRDRRARPRAESPDARSPPSPRCAPSAGVGPASDPTRTASAPSRSAWRVTSPSDARATSPFRITGRVQRSIWQSLGDYDLHSPDGARRHS
jgi:hypothetical protein